MTKARLPTSGRVRSSPFCRGPRPHRASAASAEPSPGGLSRVMTGPGQKGPPGASRLSAAAAGTVAAARRGGGGGESGATIPPGDPTRQSTSSPTWAGLHSGGQQYFAGLMQRRALGWSLMSSSCKIAGNWKCQVASCQPGDAQPSWSDASKRRSGLFDVRRIFPLCPIGRRRSECSTKEQIRVGAADFAPRLAGFRVRLCFHVERRGLPLRPRRTSSERGLLYHEEDAPGIRRKFAALSAGLTRAVRRETWEEHEAPQAQSVLGRQSSVIDHTAHHQFLPGGSCIRAVVGNRHGMTHGVTC